MRSQRVPRSWKCPEHGPPTVYGCTHCGPIVARLIDLAAKRASTPARVQLAAELVLRYAADDSAGSVPRTREDKRSIKALAFAARLYVSAVPGPTRKKLAA